MTMVQRSAEDRADPNMVRFYTRPDYFVLFFFFLFFSFLFFFFFFFFCDVFLYVFFCQCCCSIFELFRGWTSSFPEISAPSIEMYFRVLFSSCAAG